MDKPLCVKIVLVGPPGIGKTCLALKFQHPEEEPIGVIGTIGIDCYQKVLTIDDKKVSVNIWDTAGQERYRSLTRSFYKNADCAFICFSLSDISSMRQISSWKKELNDNHVYDIYLVGTQNDSSYRLPETIIKPIIDSFNLPTYYTSSFTGENVNDVFMDIIKPCIQRVEKQNKIDIVNIENPVKDSGCLCLLS